MGGEIIDFDDDNQVLSIDSPKGSVGGPYSIVYKDSDEHWAIVAMTWNGDPCLGIRWFRGDGAGNPQSSGCPTWFVIPSSLSRGILASLPIDDAFSSNVEKFLDGEMSGDELIQNTGADRK